MSSRSNGPIGQYATAEDVTAEFHANQTQQAVAQQLMLLVEASSALLVSPNSQEVLCTVIGLAQRFVSADAHSVWGSDLLGNWRILSSAGLSDEYMRTIIPARIAQATPTGPVVASDVAAEPALASRREAYAREGIRSVLLVPLSVHNQPSGTVVFYWKESHQISEAEVRVAQALGNLAAAALGAAHMYERETQARERAQRSEQRSAFLAEAGAVLNSSLDYQTTLRNVAQLAVPGFADWCSVDIVDEKGRIQQVVVQHVNPAMVQLAHEFRERYPVQEGELGRVVLRTGKAAMVETITPEMLEQGSPTPEYLDYVRKLGVASLIVVPICFHTDSLGVVTLIRSDLERPYSAEDLQTAEEIGRRAGTAVSHSRLYQNVQASEERLRLAVSAAGLGVWERDIESGEISASEQGKINFGVDPDKPITQEELTARVHKDDLESWKAVTEKAQPGGSVETEFRIWYPDGSLHTVLAFGRALESEGGRISKSIGITIDVTERRELLAREQEARRTAELLNSVGPALLSQLEIDKLVPEVTEIAAMLVGAHFGALVYHFSRAPGRGGSEIALSRAGNRMAAEDSDFERWLHSLPPDVAAQALDPGAAAARFERFPYGQEPPSNSGLHSFLVAPVRSRGGDVLGSLVLGHRVTDAFNERHVQIATGIAAQAAIALDNARLFEESRRARLALELSNMELRRVNEDLNQFAYSASHDLQEPLRMVAIYSQMLQRRYAETLDERGRQYVGYTLQGAKRMETLVKDLLAYTQAAASPDREVPFADAANVLHEALANLQTSIGESGAAFEISPLPRLRILDLHLLQIFQNLIGNAIKYRKPDEKPEIRIYAECNGSTAIIAVRDHGIGVPEQYRKHIFGLFRRLHSWDTYSGTGIGLAICQRLVERYGGKIWVESPAGGGAEFRFTLTCQ